MGKGRGRYIGLLLAGTLLFSLGCPRPRPSPSPTPRPIPTEDPFPIPPPPSPSCPPPITLDVAPTQYPPDWNHVIRDAQAQLGDRCGTDPLVSLDLLALKLGEMGYCAYRDEDRVVVRRDPPYLRLWEEHHAVYWGNGCWLSNTFRYILVSNP